MKNKILIRAVLAFSLVSIVLFFQNCSEYKSASSVLPSSTYVVQEVDKRPLISCTLTNSANRVFRRVSNISNSDETFASIAEGEQIIFNCGASMDYKGTYNITDYSVDFGSGFVNSSTGIYPYTFPTANTYVVTFILKDNEGNQLVKSIKILVKCSTATPSTLSVNSEAVTVSNGSPLGFFSYSAQGAVSGGKAPYNYAWDFNGDGIIDQQPVGSYDQWQVWSDSATSMPVHNLYTNLRNVTLVVKDACNFTKSIEKQIQFDLPRIAPAEFPTPKSYFYIQADVRRTSSASSRMSINKATNVDLNSIEAGSPDSQRHVECRYQRDKATNKGKIYVSGFNSYGFSSTEAAHGIRFGIMDIVDTGIIGVAVDRQSFPVDQAQYAIAESAEVTTSYAFEKDINCSMEVKIVRVEMPDKCENDQSITKKLIIMTGSGNCPGFTNSYAGSVSANNVKFYCEQLEDKVCPGIVAGDVPKGY